MVNQLTEVLMKVPVDHHTHPNGFPETTILHSFYVTKSHFPYK